MTIASNKLLKVGMSDFKFSAQLLLKVSPTKKPLHKNETAFFNIYFSSLVCRS